MMKKIAVLVVEENKGEQVVFETFFKDQGRRYQCTIAASVSDALRELDEKPYDVVVSDLNFIDGHVFDIMAEVKGIPFIIVTARGYEELAVMSIKKGAADYIVRDVDRHYLEILLGIITKAVLQRQNELIIEILTGALQALDECVAVLDPEGNIMFANKNFCRMFKLGSDYYLKDLDTILKEFEVIVAKGEVDIPTFLKEKRTEEAQYAIMNPDKSRTGSIRLIPVPRGLGTHMLGFVFLGRCYAEQTP
ncbi:MAG: response regulator [bacterium]|nr:response regulator [bacterium]